MLLALDTATSAVTVALLDGVDVLAESTVVEPMRHGELLAPGIDRVLAAADVAVGDLDRVAVGVGPGPFTGLRVGVVTARTLAMVLGIPAVGVCTLDIVAADVVVGEAFAVATDARRKEVYWARYGRDGRRTEGPAVVKPATVAMDGPVAGQGPQLYGELFPRAVEPRFPSASALGRIVETGSAELLAAEPLYLRRPDVSPPSAPKPVS